MKTLMLIAIIVLSISCKLEETSSGGVSGELDSILNPPMNDGQNDGTRGDVGGMCYEDDVYKVDNDANNHRWTGASFAKEIEGAVDGNSKKVFYEKFIGFALHIERVTTFPAQIIMAQLMTESAFGTSNVFKATNNPFGTSCGRKSKPWHQQTLNFGGKLVTMEIKCEKGRGLGEGGRYYHYRNIKDAFYYYAWNLIYKNHKGWSPYADIRKELQRAKSEERKPSISTLTEGLENYASSSYPSDIKKLIKQYGLERVKEHPTCERTGNNNNNNKKRNKHVAINDISRNVHKEISNYKDSTKTMTAIAKQK